MKELSKVPSEALRQAVDDVKTCADDPRYIINMAHWHTPRHGTCYVCLAGAVMAQRTDVSPDMIATPSFRDDESLTNRLFGLDDFRLGNIKGGLSSFGIEDHIVEQWYGRTHSRQSIDDLLSELLVLANDLEREGL